MSSLPSFLKSFLFLSNKRPAQAPAPASSGIADVRTGQRRRRVLAIASGGGHWVQLLRLRPAFDAEDVTYVTVKQVHAKEVPGRRFRVICDATRWSKLGLIRMACQIAWILLRERPDTIISTGAAPGYFAIRIGRWLGARTIWIDSIANAEVLSQSGQLAGRHADLWLTQWPHLAGPDGPYYVGGTL